MTRACRAGSTAPYVWKHGLGKPWHKGTGISSCANSPYTSGRLENLANDTTTDLTFVKKMFEAMPPPYSKLAFEQCHISNMVPSYYDHKALVELIGKFSHLGDLDPDRVTRTLR